MSLHGVLLYCNHFLESKLVIWKLYADKQLIYKIMIIRLSKVRGSRIGKANRVQTFIDLNVLAFILNFLFLLMFYILISWIKAWQLWRDNKTSEIVDPSLANSFPTPEALQCVQVCLLCVQNRTTDRPSMSTVVLC